MIEPRSAGHLYARAHQIMHASAVICFLLAIFFYSFAWNEAAFGLAFFGVVFEIVAWVIWLTTYKAKQNP